MRTRFVLTAACIALVAPAGAALAHDDDYEYRRHRQDHREHRDFHGDVQELHDELHDRGLIRSRRQHRELHRAIEGTHDEFHYDHPNTRHDHDRRRGYDRGYDDRYGYDRYRGRGYDGGW